ncbi:hypothetical protein MKX42_10020 [Paenibacillus sp. FSL R7-0204]|uniref:hypothetical protein n=1 Tax=Paenibacillus sp. FSL R7-0204 TaxID=2921675 RepID=UPI0030FAC696
MKKLITTFSLIAGITAVLFFFPQLYQGPQKDGVNIITMKKDFRAWQGVGSDGKVVYVTSDRDENFLLSNTISEYKINGDFITEKTEAYTGKDPSNRFMSFGDNYVLGDFLYATVYNFNSSPPEKERVSRIVKYSLPDLKQVKEYEIGDGTAESVTLYKDCFWVVYHDKNEIRKFDANFKLMGSYPLSGTFGGEGGYQGIFFEGDTLYGNLHGSNEKGQKYAQGLDSYKFDGEKFKLIERIKPPTYGAGQGIEKVGDTYFWADRPDNTIVMTKSLK